MKKQLLNFLSFVLTILILACNQGQGKDEDKTTNKSECFLCTDDYKTVFKDSDFVVLRKANYSFEKNGVKMVPTDPSLANDYIDNWKNFLGAFPEKIKAHSVTFSLTDFLAYYSIMADEAGTKSKALDSLRIYIIKYPANFSRAEYASRISTLLVTTSKNNDGTGKGFDFFGTSQLTWPRNLGTLCPPDCNTAGRTLDKP